MKKATEKFIHSAEESVRHQGVGAAIYIRQLAEKKRIEDSGDEIDQALSFNSYIDFSANCYLHQFQCTQRSALNTLLSSQEGILNYILKADLSTHSFVEMSILLGYFRNYTLASRYISGTMGSNNETHLKKIFPCLWGKFETDAFANPDDRESYTALEMVFDYLNHDYETVIRKFENNCVADLLKFENSSRTIMKLCMYLSRLRKGDTDDNTQFGADTMIALIQYQYYLWLVKEELSAKVDLPLVMLLTYMHGDLRGFSEEEMHKSMQPCNVIVRLTDMKSR